MKNSKNLLAKLLATENITVITKATTTASFDLEKRILYVPIFKKELSDNIEELFIGHEVGHAFWTSAEGWHDSIVKLGIPRSYLNIVEDARIEKKIKQKYPGLRPSFYHGYIELNNMGFFGDLNEARIKTMNFIDRINIHYKLNHIFKVQFDEEESKFIPRLDSMETFEDAYKLAEEIFKFAKSRLEKIASDTDTIMEDVGQEMYAYGSEIGNNSLQSETDWCYRENEETLFDIDASTEFAYTPEYNIENLIIDYTQIVNMINMTKLIPKTNPYDYKKFQKDKKPLINHLVSEFELKKNAQQMRKQKISKIGDLDPKKLFQNNFSDNLFKQLTISDGGKSHGLVVYVDWSASMNSCLDGTIHQLLIITEFCLRERIQFEIYTFTDTVYNTTIRKKVQKQNDNALVCNNLGLSNILSSRMKRNEYITVVNFLLSYTYYTSCRNNRNQSKNIPGPLRLSGTPLNEAILSVIQVSELFKKNNKVDVFNVIFITDGEGVNINFKFNKTIPNRFIANRTFIHYHKNLNIKMELSDQKSNWHGKDYIKFVKEIVGCNIIGFYITNSLKNISTPINAEKAKEFTTNGVMVFDEKDGFDEYYLINVNKFINDVKDFEKSKNSMLIGMYTDGLKKLKSVNVIYDRFINLIKE